MLGGVNVVCAVHDVVRVGHFGCSHGCDWGLWLLDWLPPPLSKYGLNPWEKCGVSTVWIDVRLMDFGVVRWVSRDWFSVVGERLVVPVDDASIPVGTVVDVSRELLQEPSRVVSSLTMVVVPEPEKCG